MRRKLRVSCIASSFYIKPQLRRPQLRYRPRCIASSFYIKPQLRIVEYFTDKVVLHPLSTSNHNQYVLTSNFATVVLHPLSTSNHNSIVIDNISRMVVLHPLSTSNHNFLSELHLSSKLYCILFLHQTTTSLMFPKLVLVLYCILFLHQTTTRLYTEMDSYRCIASSFYIKPQLKRSDMFIIIVVLHPLSTSNHNKRRAVTLL